MDIYYTGAVAVSSVALLALIQGIRGNIFLPQRTIHRFQLLFSIVIAANCAEWLAAMLNGAAPGLRWIHILAKLTEMVLAPMVPLVCAMAIGKRKLPGYMFIPVILNSTLQLLSVFFGGVFSVTAENVYVRGPLYTVYCLMFAAEVVLLFLHCMQFSRTYQNTNALFLVNINLFVMIAMVLPLMVSELRLDWTIVSFSSILIYLYYDQLVQQTDGLTQLLSRRSLDVALSRLHRPATLFFMDVNGFKTINDTFGHAYGDSCLTTLSGELKIVFENIGCCYRYGGDEFCVISHKPLEHPEQLAESLRQRIEKVQQSDENFPGISIGWSAFTPGSLSAAESLEQADTWMYHNKRK